MAEAQKKSDVAAALLKQLKDPFDPKLVKFRPGGGQQLAYVDARDVMKRLDDVLGTENWSDKYIAVDGGFICELSLRIAGEWITKSNGANTTKVEAVKGGISGALKRAAVNFGIGRYLYYMPKGLHSGNVDTWPSIFKPGAPENWEDIAELEAELDSGMDEVEIAGAVLGLVEKIQSAETKEQLNAIVDKMSAEEKHQFTNIIVNKTEELVGGNTDDTTEG